MRALALALAAATLFAADPRTPAVDCAVPLPYTGGAETIWHDSFDGPDFPGGYFELVANGGRFGLSEEAALGGRGAALRGVFDEGTVSAGSLKLAFGDSPVGRVVQRAGEKFTEVYWRLYVKHQRGWTGNPAKLSRATILAGSNWSQAMIAHVWGGRGHYLTLDPATGIDAAGQLATRQYNDFERLRWLGNQPPAGYPIFATEESGRWVAVEAGVRLNTPGESDGAFWLWIDGRLESFREGLNWRGTWDERGLNAIFLENYWNDGSPVRQVRYFDEFTVATRPIGLARNALQPELLKTPFEDPDEGDAQGGFQFQVATADGTEIVWDSGMRAGAGDRVRVDAAGGRFRGRLAGRTELEPDTLYSARVRQRDRGGNWSDWSAWRIVIRTGAGEPE